MNQPDFEWEDFKNAQNKEKHGVSFYGAGYLRKGKKIYEKENQIHG
jgi:uncharacterized DUF497 family protein